MNLTWNTMGNYWNISNGMVSEVSRMTDKRNGFGSTFLDCKGLGVCLKKEKGLKYICRYFAINAICIIE